MKKGDVVSLVTLTGEFVGKFEDHTSAGVKLKIHAGLSMVNRVWALLTVFCQTGKKDPTDVEFFSGGIVFVTECNEDVEKAYRSATSGLIL